MGIALRVQIPENISLDNFIRGWKPE